MNRVSTLQGGSTMFRKRGASVLVPLLALIACLLPLSGEATQYRVLVVMSYHETMPWEREIREGIESQLSRSATIRYVYMNTKNDFAGGAVRAREALRFYREFRPHGVIAADDDAVAMFVVPYLKDRVTTPVMFCGVNEEPKTYGFPASNVSGILERAHFRESIAFLHQIYPSLTRMAFLTMDNPTGRAYARQIRREAESYPATVSAIRLVKDLNQALAVTGNLKSTSDALFVIAMEGLPDPSGRPLAEKNTYRLLSRAYGKPVIGMNDFNIRAGLLCAVVKTGQEQGSTAARMLLRAMEGTPVSRIPITRNRMGKRLLNVSVMKSLGITPRPVFLVGTQLVETEND
jgi:ABC-type uncharacterized transport system substrate-binding protein